MEQGRILLRFLALILLLPVLGCSGSSEKAGPKPALMLTGRVTDAANLLSDSEEKMLTAKLAALETQVGPQLVIATTPTLGGQDINVYSLKLARAWGLGSNERNDGIVLLVAPNERRVRIEVGTGLERTLPNSLCKQVIETDIAPNFRKGNMVTGIEQGVDAIIGTLQAAKTPARKAA